MTKRAGTVRHMEDLVDAVGVDAARYALVRIIDRLEHRHRPRPADQEHQRQPRLLRAVRARAHCRSPAMRRQPASTAPRFDPSLLAHETESVLLGALADLPRVSLQAAEFREPHRVARYLEDLARRLPLVRRVPRDARADDPISDVHRTRLCAQRRDRTGAAQRARPARRRGAGSDVTNHPNMPQPSAWPSARHATGPRNPAIRSTDSAALRPKSCTAYSQPSITDRRYGRVGGTCAWPAR